jgi:zinc-ribbon domain
MIVSAEVLMFCDRCGAQMADTARFCPGCGKPFAPPMAPPPVPQVPMNRVARHIRNVGILWIVYSCIHLIPGLIVGSLPHWLGFWGRDTFWFPGGIFHVVGGFLMLKGVLGLIAGWGLLDRQSWARMLVLILSFFSLFHPPLGTALGIYTLWVLLPGYSEMEYRTMAR